MSLRVLRRVVVPVAVAVLVAAVILGIFRLADPSGTAPGGTVGASPGSGGGVAGSPGSAADTPAAASPTADPDQPMSRFTSVRPGADGSSIDLRFWGGVDTCYRYRVQAEETETRVSLRLRERNTHDGPCIDLAQEYERSVPLVQPLAAREVVDAVTGEVLLSP